MKDYVRTPMFAKCEQCGKIQNRAREGSDFKKLCKNCEEVRE